MDFIHSTIHKYIVFVQKLVIHSVSDSLPNLYAGLYEVEKVPHDVKVNGSVMEANLKCY